MAIAVTNDDLPVPGAPYNKMPVLYNRDLSLYTGSFDKNLSRWFVICSATLSSKNKVYNGLVWRSDDITLKYNASLSSLLYPPPVPETL